MRTLLLDLGSHSAKAYLRDELKNGQLDEVGVMTWSLLESEAAISSLESVLDRLITPFRSNCERLMAIGTKAMRRSPELSIQAQKACSKLGIQYRTLTQKEEALLIRSALPEAKGFDIINVGGGSIQIISGVDATLALLGFGISDLNRMFGLTDKPEKRKVRECIGWVVTQLPERLGQFVYTGGEERYLRHMGIPLAEGACQATHFSELAKGLSVLEMAELEALSPYDPKWMRGAIASNCIVLACLEKSGTSSFMPSNTNIAYGLIHGASEE
jgi:hypothetical protein